MKLLDVIFCVDVVNDFGTYKDSCDYWSINEAGEYLMLKLKEDSKMGNTVDINIVGFIPYLEDMWWKESPIFIPYDNLIPLKKIEVNFDGEYSFANGQKYPLICVRGTCSGKCNQGCHQRFYCFNELPCTNGRPDWNVWSCKYPNFYDLLLDAVKLLGVCSDLNALVVQFEYTPYVYSPELDFMYAYAMEIIGNQITVICNSKKIAKLYKEYNTKYPTQDRQIENSISDTDNNFYFRF